MSTIFRESEVAISHETKWKLRAVVKARNGGVGALAKMGTVDQLAEEILSDWITETHPKLNEIYRRREDLDDEANTAVAEVENIKPEKADQVPF